ncbi:MAG TPA: type II CAAX endopeptidase family protein [Vicinamibacterales bacterium]
MDPAAPITQPPIGAAPVLLPFERVGAAFEVILCSGFPTQIVIIIILSTLGMKVRLADGRLSPPFVFALTLLDTALLVGLIVFFLRAHRESVRDLFGSRPKGREILFGLALIPASFLVVIFVLLVVQILVPGLRNVAHNPLQDLARNRWDAVVFAFVVMIAGGVREEIQRGFVLRRFEQYLGGGAAGLVIFSALFGLGHLEQGRDVALATGILGAFWGAIFLRRRSIVGPMVGHAGFNLLQVIKFLTVAG